MVGKVLGAGGDVEMSLSCRIELLCICHRRSGGPNSPCLKSRTSMGTGFDATLVEPKEQLTTMLSFFLCSWQPTSPPLSQRGWIPTSVEWMSRSKDDSLMFAEDRASLGQQAMPFTHKLIPSSASQQRTRTVRPSISSFHRSSRAIAAQN